MAAVVDMQEGKWIIAGELIDRSGMQMIYAHTHMQSLMDSTLCRFSLVVRSRTHPNPTF